MIDEKIYLIGDEIAKTLYVWKKLDYFVKYLTLKADSPITINETIIIVF